MPLDLTQLVQDCHAYAKKQGFWDEKPTVDTIPAKLMLIVSELAEAMENDRDDGDDLHFAEELADAIIRICDLAGWLELDLDMAVSKKMAQNETRPKLHGKLY